MRSPLLCDPEVCGRPAVVYIDFTAGSLHTHHVVSRRGLPLCEQCFALWEEDEQDSVYTVQHLVEGEEIVIPGGRVLRVVLADHG